MALTFHCLIVLICMLVFGGTSKTQTPKRGLSVCLVFLIPTLTSNIALYQAQHRSIEDPRNQNQEQHKVTTGIHKTSKQRQQKANRGTSKPTFCRREPANNKTRQCKIHVLQRQTCKTENSNVKRSSCAQESLQKKQKRLCNTNL